MTWFCASVSESSPVYPIFIVFSWATIVGFHSDLSEKKTLCQFKDRWHHETFTFEWDEKISFGFYLDEVPNRLALMQLTAAFTQPLVHLNFTSLCESSPLLTTSNSGFMSVLAPEELMESDQRCNRCVWEGDIDWRYSRLTLRSHTALRWCSVSELSWHYSYLFLTVDLNAGFSRVFIFLAFWQKPK